MLSNRTPKINKVFLMICEIINFNCQLPERGLRYFFFEAHIPTGANAHTRRRTHKYRGRPLIIG